VWGYSCTVNEVEADDIGVSLRNATAKVAKAAEDHPGALGELRSALRIAALYHDRLVHHPQRGGP
jgi:hypothetical protein